MEVTSANAAQEAGTSAVRVFTTIEELFHLRNVWSSWCKHPNSGFEEFLLQSRFRPGVVRPHVIVVYSDGIPDCILAGWLLHTRRTMNIGGARIRMPRERMLAFMRDGVLGNQSAENSALLLRSVLDFLGQHEADRAELRNLPLQSPLYRAATTVPGWLSRDHFPLPVAHCRMVLPTSFDEFLAALPRATRHNFRTYARRIQAHFPNQIQIQRLEEPEHLEILLGVVEQIASRTQQRKLGGGFLNNAVTREELTLAAEKGVLRSYVLYLNDVPCAFLIGKQHGDTIFARFTGYDPQFRRYSPGMYLLLHCVRELCDSSGGKRVSSYDFGPGNQRYNNSLSNAKWLEATVNIFARRPRALTINFMFTVIAVMHRFTRTALTRTKSRDHIVRKWRSVAMNWRKWLSPAPSPVVLGESSRLGTISNYPDSGKEV